MSFSLFRWLWELVKRPFTALLLLSSVFLFVLDAFWTFHGVLWTIQSLALLLFSILFFGLAVLVALRRHDETDSWRPFIGMAVLTFIGLLIASDYWWFYVFPAACAFVGAILGAKVRR